jgi:hypothetical protein
MYQSVVQMTKCINANDKYFAGSPEFKQQCSSANHQLGVIYLDGFILRWAICTCGFNYIVVFPEKHIREGKQAGKFATLVHSNQTSKFMATTVKECINNV